MLYKYRKIYTLLFFFLFSFIVSNNTFSSPFNEKLLLSSYVRSIPLAEGEVLIKLKKNKYSIEVNAHSVGLFSVVLDWRQTIKSFGKIENNRFTSFRYQSLDFRGKKSGHMEVDFKDIIPKIISAQPDPREDKRRSMSDGFLLKANDPVAGIFNLALDQCKNTVKIYDGKRRYNIKVLEKEVSLLEDSYLSKNIIKAYKCNYEIERIAGYTKKELAKFPKKGEIWIKKHSKFSFYYPVKIQIKTNWGNFLCYTKERRV
tara:strand:- start:290 stop:1063 length:774 start_codon:yes stop_codon:yes gene_type:complete